MFHEREKHSCASLTHTITEKERETKAEKKVSLRSNLYRKYVR